MDAKETALQIQDTRLAGTQASRGPVYPEAPGTKLGSEFQEPVKPTCCTDSKARGAQQKAVHILQTLNSALFYNKDLHSLKCSDNGSNENLESYINIYHLRQNCK